MRFWDSSALIPLVIDEERSARARTLLQADPEVIVSWAAVVECGSALRRRERHGFDPTEIRQAFQRLDEGRVDWQEVEPVEEVRRLALRLLAVHDLRAGDALQLAAAIVAAEGKPESLQLVTLDDRLRLAGEREGFPVLP